MWSDLRFALRTLVKRPRFSFMAILALVLGIGVNAAIFSVTYSVVLRPLPFAEPDRLVRLWESNPAEGKERDQASPADVLDWQEQSRTLKGIAYWLTSSLTLGTDGAVEELNAAQVSPSFFEVFGVAPAVGRGFTPEDSEHQVVVISAGLAERLFGSKERAVGATVTLEGEAHDVIGVMERGFAVPQDDIQVWKPRVFKPGQLRYRRYLDAVGRLAPGVTLAQAHRDLNAIASRLATAYPDTNAGCGVVLVPLYEQVVGNAGRQLFFLFGAAGFLLLIACANVASLYLARAIAQQQEMGIRHVLGATRPRLIRQVLVESLVLALAAGALAFLAARWVLSALLAIEPGNLPRVHEITVGPGTFAFTVAVALATGLALGLLAAFRTAAPSASQRVVGMTDPGARRELQGLVIAEIALAVVLLVGTGLLIRSLTLLRRVDPGYRIDNLLVAAVNLDAKRYEESEQKLAYFQSVVEQVGALPGVKSAAAVTALPLSPAGVDFDLEYEVEGKPMPEGQTRQAMVRVVTPGYFETLGIALKAGRPFAAADRAHGEPVVIVNETLTRQVWPGEKPLDKRLGIFGRQFRVVGLAADTRFYGLDEAPRPEIFVPLAQISWYSSMHFVARTSVPPETLADAVRRTLLAVDPAQPPVSLVTMSDLLDRSLARDRFLTLLLTVMGTVALLLSVCGVYGVMAYAVSRRLHEVGVRMALGARRREILGLVVRQGVMLAILGLTIGLVAAWLLGDVMRNLVFGIGPHDPVTFGAVALGIIAVAIIASLAPALRASRVDPAVTLRYE